MTARSFVLLCSALFLGGCGLSLASPEGDVNLQISGSVKDAVSGSPIAGASVVVTTGFFGSGDLTSVSTGADGRYVLTYHLRHVATDKELSDGCNVWDGDTSRNVSVYATAPGYGLRAETGADGVAPLQCTGNPQTFDFRLRK
ncbi:MAG TPA: carboxypeptidase-like regulatory domain-containing protein [Gemmatimonadaceae bacterium]|nr:carboxypeptidase-like regulatory domain-containing protein [Gemmatimonadaceae bacterium]